jgi:NAD(P)-dependent dehydrogenase (short-subunit alcohol dehydrogenase family)
MEASQFSLRGKVAVITGASRGIGRTIATALARAGASLALIGRDASALQSIEGELTWGASLARCFVGDVSDTPRLDPLFDQIVDSLGCIDILINNAGIEQKCDSREVPESLWDRILDVNLKAAFFCAQAAAKRMQAGSIINVCSLTSEVGVPQAAAYGASKSGLASLTRTLATEWASAGIRVNGIGPGYFRTALTEPFYEDENWQRHMLEKIPMRRFGRMEDLGGPVVFLCSDAAAYITGQILYIDGGYLASV